ncbi:MAG: M20 family metallopeptidase [Solirubrobacteraceae bacterium]|nr:M20 family metallopeptidase [Solirubrobacteraceae bacterium]
MLDPERLAPQLREGALRARADLVSLLLELSAIDAPSGGGDALGRFEERLAAELRELGAEVRRHPGPVGAQLEARLGPPAGEPILVLCHYDTVWPVGTAAERPAHVADGRVHGPGTYDMRGGIVAALGAARLLGEQLERPLRMLFTPDEETGSATSRELIVRLGRGAAAVLVTEPPLPGGALKTARKGWATYVVETLGRAAHAGIEPERGVSAIDELVDALLAIRALADPAAGTTINIGRIEGGELPNVVAPRALAIVDVRASRVEEQQRIDAALTGLTALREGATIAVAKRHGRPPMERTPQIAQAAVRAIALASLLGIELGEGAVGGTSDANLLAPLGIPVIDGLGPDGRGAHALDEQVIVDSLVERTALIALLIAAL